MSKPVSPRFKTYLLLAGIALLGCCLIAIGMWREVIFLEHLGSALLVGAVLGLTIEGALRTELVADAVKAALGWVLPPPLRQELDWIYEQALIWRDTEIEIHIDEREQFVIAKCKIHRTLENVSSKAQKNVHIRFSIDEWGVNGLPTKITEFRFRTKKDTYGFTDLTMVKTETGPTHVAAHPDFPIDLEPGDKVEQWIAYEETRGKNDQLYITHRYPIAGAAVTFTASDGIKATPPGFHFAGKYDERKDIGGGKYEVSRTLLPHQAILLRWYPKNHSVRLG